MLDEILQLTAQLKAKNSELENKRIELGIPEIEKQITEKMNLLKSKGTEKLQEELKEQETKFKATLSAEQTELSEKMSILYMVVNK